MKGPMNGVKAVARGDGKAAELSGHPVQVLLGSMGQGMTMYEAETHPGAGTDANIQSGDVYLYVVEGVYQIFAGEKVTIAGAGTAVFVPSGVAHGFTNIGENPARLIGFTAAKLVEKTPRAHEEQEGIPLAALNSPYGYQLCIDCIDV